MHATQGAYVQFPFEALLAVTAQESVKNKCLVIGEDLGTVPENFRETLADWGIWSYQVMMFERDKAGAFRPPQEYPENALVTFTTHDLPTFAGWASHHDLAVKRQLGIDPGENDEDRDKARSFLNSALGKDDTQSPDFAAVAKHLAAAPSRLLVVTLEDALGIKDQPNVPGTMTEHPNWRRRVPFLLEDLDRHPNLISVAEALAAAGRSYRIPK
jgi:4-alpha-glucanotransferase